MGKVIVRVVRDSIIQIKQGWQVLVKSLDFVLNKIGMEDLKQGQVFSLDFDRVGLMIQEILMIRILGNKILCNLENVI